MFDYGRSCIKIGLLATLAVIGRSAAAATLTWDSDANSSNGITDGDGTWSLSGSNWFNGGSDQLWANTTDTAEFGNGGYSGRSTAYTVTLSGPANAGGIIFQSQAYSLSGSTLNLAGATPTITVNASGGTIGSVLAGTTGLTESGTGMLTLTAANTYAGGTTISQGALQLNNSAAAGAGTITLGDTNTGGANVQLNINDPAVANAVTVANPGPGTATISYLLSGSALTYGSTATWTLNQPAILTAPNLTAGAYLQFAPILSGTGALIVGTTNTGRLILTGSASPSFTGDITIQDGAIFEPRGDLTAAAGNNVDVNAGGILQIVFGNTSINALNGGGTVQSNSFDSGGTDDTLTVGIGNGSGSFAGTVMDNGHSLALAKAGSGNQVLSGVNAYSGPTTISGGTLSIGGGGSLGLGAYAGNIAIASGAALSYNSSAAQTFSGAISGGGGLTQSSGLLTLAGSNTYTGNTSIGGGSLLMTAGQLQSSTVSVGSATAGTFAQSGGANNATSALNLGNNSPGLYMLGGGSLTSPLESVGVNSCGTLTQSGGINTATSELTVGSGAMGLYTLSGGSLISPGEYVGSSSSGTLTQTGGVNNATTQLGLGDAGPGLYTLGGGSLTSPSEFVGVNSGGTLTQTGGINNVTSTLSVGSGAPGLYMLSGGSLTAPVGYVGEFSSGTLTQTGGTNNITSYLIIGSYAPGVYNLSGSGVITAPYELLGYSSSSGSLTQTAGANNVTSQLAVGDFAPGLYVLGGGSLTAPDEFLGYLSSGTLTQTGGANTVTNQLEVGSHGPSRYTLAGGSLTAVSEFVGVGGGGTFAQTGGINNATSELSVGSGAASQYTLSGGSLAAPTEAVGDFSSGTLTQTGGTDNVGSLTLGSHDASGTYNLIGGLLELATLSVGSGTAQFNFSGGTLRTGGSFAASLPIALNVAGGIANFDTGAGSATLALNLSGPGGLQKVGAGTTFLAGTNTYTGPTSVSGGTLVVQTDIPSTSYFSASSGGTLLFLGATLILDLRSVYAAAGGTVTYQDATVNGGFLFGPGTHILPAGSATTFNAATINPTAVVVQYGTDTFNNVTNRGQLSNNGYLTFSGGINDGGGTLTVNGTSDVSDWTNAGVITINNDGLLDNHANSLTSFGGGQIYVNPGGTLNADSQNEGIALDLQDGLLVNNGTITGTTNVYYGATVSGSGSFGPINVFQGGTLAIAPSASPILPGLVVSSGRIAGTGQSATPVTIDAADIVVPDLTNQLLLSGNLSGSGALTKLGPGTLVLSGSNTYAGGTFVVSGTLVATNPTAIPGGGGLTIGAGGTFIFDPSVAAWPATSAAASQVIPVPEPGTLLLLTIAVCGAGLCLGTYGQPAK